MVRTALDNPFSPGSDEVPSIFAGRRRQLADFTAELRPRRVAGLYERGRLMMGEPGVGKSVLVGRLADVARSSGDWTTGQVRFPRGVDPFQLVAEALLDVAERNAPHLRRERRLRDLFARVESIGLSGVGIGLRSPDGRPAHRSLFEMLVALSEHAAAHDCMVLVHLDEVQNLDVDEHASALLTALGDALAHTTRTATPGGGSIDRHLPLAVYLTALPEFGDTATARRGATFTRRFATTLLGPLDDDELREALAPLVAGEAVPDGEGGTATVVLQRDAADAIVAASYRDPFLFQLVGYRTWMAGRDRRITLDDVHRGVDDAKDEMVLHVDRLLDRLPDLQRAFVEAMTGLAPEARSLTAIAEALGASGPERLGSTTQALEGKGVVARGRPYRLLVPALEARLDGSLSPG